MAVPTIETFGLSKRYGSGEKFALHDFDLTVNAGEAYGLLGPNGAGKTTTIRLLMNFIQPTFGSAVIQGRDVVWQSTEIKKNVGYLAGEMAFYPRMTGKQFIHYLASIQPPKNRRFANSLVRLFDVDINKKISDLSKGNRQKLGLIQAFMHEPRVLILDEPTAGLDPLMQEVFYELVRIAKSRGATLLVSSHNLTEVQKICDKVGFIRKGRKIAELDVNDLSRSAIQTYDVAFADKIPIAGLRAIGGVKVRANTPHHASISVRGDLNKLFGFLAQQKVLSIDRQEISLENEFLKYFKGDLK